MPCHSSVLLSWTQFWRACGVGARTHFVLEFKGRTPIGALPIECRERDAISMLSHCVDERSTQSLERHSLLLFHPDRKNKKNCWRSLCRVSGLFWCSGVWKNASALRSWLQDQKANATLTALVLRDNHVGDAGATALADALQATVSACGHTVFQECASCCHRCCFARWCEQLASPSCCEVCVAFFSCVSKENVAWRGVLFASCFEVDVALFQNRTGLIECLVIGICLVAVGLPHRVIRTVAAPCE